MRRREEPQQGIIRMFGQWTTIGISVLAKPEGTDEGIFGGQSFRHVNFDTSRHEQFIARAAALRDRYPDCFIGTDPWMPIGRPLEHESKSRNLRPTTNASSTKGASASASGRGRICGNNTITRREQHAK